jgi:hypothetical protein
MAEAWIPAFAGMTTLVGLGGGIDGQTC